MISKIERSAATPFHVKRGKISVSAGVHETLPDLSLLHA